MEKIPHPGDTIEVNGRTYEISSVDLSAETRGRTTFVSVRVRTKLSPERVEVTTITAHHQVEAEDD